MNAVAVDDEEEETVAAAEGGGGGEKRSVASLEVAFEGGSLPVGGDKRRRGEAEPTTPAVFVEARFPRPLCGNKNRFLQVPGMPSHG